MTDPIHFKVLTKIVKILKVLLYNEAISDKVGEATLKNYITTTGSFLKDNKSAYGPIKKFKVKTNTIKNLNKKLTLKIDAEGSEIDILSVWKKMISKMDVVRN